jgi:cell division protein FtsB
MDAVETVESLEARNAELEKTVEDLEEEVDDLEKKVEDLEEEVEDLEAEIADLRTSPNVWARLALFADPANWTPDGRFRPVEAHIDAEFPHMLAQAALDF